MLPLLRNPAVFGLEPTFAVGLVGTAHALSTANPIARFVAGDPVSPGRKGGGVSELSDPPADHDPSLLEHVPGGLLIVCQTPSETPKPILPTFDQFGKRFGYPLLSSDDQQFIVDSFNLVICQ